MVVSPRFNFKRALRRKVRIPSFRASIRSSEAEASFKMASSPSQHYDLPHAVPTLPVPIPVSSASVQSPPPVAVLGQQCPGAPGVVKRKRVSVCGPSQASRALFCDEVIDLTGTDDESDESFSEHESDADFIDDDDVVSDREPSSSSAESTDNEFDDADVSMAVQFVRQLDRSDFIQCLSFLSGHRAFGVSMIDSDVVDAVTLIGTFHRGISTLRGNCPHMIHGFCDLCVIRVLTILRLAGENGSGVGGSQ